MDTLESLQSALSDSYRLERELGRGGMAAVYLAQDVKHDREVAVKVLDAEIAASRTRRLNASARPSSWTPIFLRLIST
jgi:serine/threonine protein kinase